MKKKGRTVFRIVEGGQQFEKQSSPFCLFLVVEILSIFSSFMYKPDFQK